MLGVPNVGARSSGPWIFPCSFAAAKRSHQEPICFQPLRKKPRHSGLGESAVWQGGCCMSTQANENQFFLKYRPTFPWSLAKYLGRGGWRWGQLGNTGSPDT